MEVEGVLIMHDDIMAADDLVKPEGMVLSY